MEGNERLTNEELAEIRKRAEAATEDPWFVEGKTVYSSGVLLAGTYPAMICDECDVTEAEFIAHAREDVPKLLAEIERLKIALENVADLTEIYPKETMAGGAYLYAKEALENDD
jgi:hypothetical protein